MLRLKIFFKNALILGGVSIFMRLTSVAFNAYAASRVGAEGIGLYSLIMSVYYFAVTFACSGVSLGVTRLVSEELAHGRTASAKSAVKRCILYALCFGGTASAALFIFAKPIGEKLIGDCRTVMSLRALAFSLPFIALCGVFSGYFNAVHRIIKSASSSVIEQFVKISLTAFLFSLLMPKGIEYACLSLVLGTSVSEGLTFIYLLIFYIYDRKKHLSSASDKNISPDLNKRLFSVSLPIALSSYLRSGLVTLEHILIPSGLRKYGADYSASIASYGVIHGMVFPLILFPSAVNSTFAGLIVPELSELRSVYGNI